MSKIYYKFNSEELSSILSLMFWIGVLLMALCWVIFPSYAYTTEESITLDKISYKSNLTENQKVIFYNLLKDKISNETELIKDTEKELKKIIDDVNETYDNQVILINNEIKKLKKNITD